MKRYLVIFAAAAGLLIGAMPVSADTAFNEMAACVKSWGKCCETCKGGAKTAAKACCPKAMTSVDALGNKTSTMTNNSGQIQLGR